MTKVVSKPKRKRPSMKAYQDAQIGDEVVARTYGKTVKGTVVRKHPGSLVLDLGDTRLVVDADKIIKTIKQ